MDARCVIDDEMKLCSQEMTSRFGCVDYGIELARVLKAQS